jgi:hypothetical protein
MRLKIAYLLLPLILLALVACEGGEEYVTAPPGIIPEDSMVNILVDFHLVEGALLDKQQQNEPTVPAVAEYYDLIYSKHNISRKRFDEAVDFYSYHPRLYTKIYDKVLAELSRLQGESMQVSGEKPKYPKK